MARAMTSLRYHDIGGYFRQALYLLLQGPGLDIVNGEIRVTHPGPIDIWLNLDEIRDTLEAQRGVVTSKNTRIQRVFVDADAVDVASAHDSNYDKVMRDMSAYNILWYYVYRENPTRVRDITWIPTLGIFTESFLRPGGNVG